MSKLECRDTLERIKDDSPPTQIDAMLGFMLVEATALVEIAESVRSATMCLARVEKELTRLADEAEKL